MATMCAFVTVVTLNLLAARGVSSHQQVSSGQCVMYGTCGISPITRMPVPCVYNGPAKPLTDPSDRRILNEMCPDLAQDKNTCCDSSQLKDLQSSLDVPRQVLGNCPACLHNFQNIFCYMVCNPSQSKYLAVTDSFNSTSGKSVKDIHYDLATTFTDGMFNSCKDVNMPSAGEKAIGILCGHTPDKCTPKNWLAYMGSTSNGETPFDVNFTITDHSETLPSGITLNPMNATAVPCSSPVGNRSACSCQDCGSIPCTTTPPPLIPVYPCATLPERSSPLLYEHTASAYQSISLVIKRTGHAPPIKHDLPPPSSQFVMFNAIFNKTFLHEVLDLLTAIQAMKFTFHTTKVGLEDVCLHGPDSKHCVIPSPLQYFQNSHENLDKVKMDPSGFFTLDDYLDHLLSCFRYPQVKTDYLPLNMSCISEYGGVVTPPVVFCGYESYNYQNSTAVVATFVIKDPRTSAASAAWRTGLLDFVDKWQIKHKDVLITTYQPTQYL